MAMHDNLGLMDAVAAIDDDRGPNVGGRFPVIDVEASRLIYNPTRGSRITTAVSMERSIHR